MGLASEATSDPTTPTPTPTPPATPTPVPDPSAAKEEEGGGIFGKIKRFFFGSKMDKERLMALGMGAFASYGEKRKSLDVKSRWILHAACMLIDQAAFVAAVLGW